MTRWLPFVVVVHLSCRQGLPSNHGLPAPENDHLEVRGAETWTVDGKQTRILGTYYMALVTGVQFTIELPEGPSTPAAAEDEWWPIVRDAFASKRYLRSKVDFPGLGSTSASRIEVVFRPNPARRGEPLRFVQGLGDIQYRMSQEAAAKGSLDAPSNPALNPTGLRPAG